MSSSNAVWVELKANLCILSCALAGATWRMETLALPSTHQAWCCFLSHQAGDAIFLAGDAPLARPARWTDSTAPSASRMTRILLVALSVAGRRAKQPTGAHNASHHGGKNSNCRRYVQNEGDISRWCGRITARDQPGTPDILVIFPLVSIHNSP